MIKIQKMKIKDDYNRINLMLQLSIQFTCIKIVYKNKFKILI